MLLYTIGFTKKSAETFFELLKKHQVSKLIDIRLNSASQLAGFAKGSDLEYFTRVILNIEYIPQGRLAPTKEIFDGFRAGALNWNEFVQEFNNILTARNVKGLIETEYRERMKGACLLCSEAEPDRCHRRLVAEFIKVHIPETEIIHL